MREASGLTPPPAAKHGDGGALYTFNGISTEAWRAVSPSEAQWRAAVGYTEARPAVAIFNSDSTLDRSATTGARRSLVVGMTHFNSEEPLDDVSTGATFTPNMPRDADGAYGAISAPIGVKGFNITMA